MADIPNPLRSGSATLVGSTLPGAGVYKGDVGSLTATAPAALVLQNGAIASVTVNGTGDPPETSSSAHFATFEAIGNDSLALTQVGGGRSSLGPGIATVNIDQGAVLATTANTDLDGFVTYNGPGVISGLNGAANGGSVTVNTDVTGVGSFTLASALPADGGQLDLNGAVTNSGEIINIRDGLVTLEKPLQFLGSIEWAPGNGVPNTSLTLKNTPADSYSYDGATLHFYKGSSDIQDVKFSDKSGQPFHVAQNGADIVVRLPTSGPGFPGVDVPIHPPTPTTPGPSPNFLVFDVNHQQATLLPGDPYTGPVAGLQNQIILDTSDNLNVVPVTDNVFVHTGSGEDAISFAGMSGNNVADGGTGSNFMTSGNGNDTFFNDARGVTADIWNTIQGFHTGDASTLWGVTSANYNLDWVQSDGAAGAKGLTLHATSKSGGPEVSVTYAGKADMSGLSISENPATNYTYITQT